MYGENRMSDEYMGFRGRGGDRACKQTESREKKNPPTHTQAPKPLIKSVLGISLRAVNFQVMNE